MSYNTYGINLGECLWYYMPIVLFFCLISKNVSSLKRFSVSPQCLTGTWPWMLHEWGWNIHRDGTEGLVIRSCTFPVWLQVAGREHAAVQTTQSDQSPIASTSDRLFQEYFLLIISEHKWKSKRRQVAGEAFSSVALEVPGEISLQWNAERCPPSAWLYGWQVRHICAQHHTVCGEASERPAKLTGAPSAHIMPKRSVAKFWVGRNHSSRTTNDYLLWIFHCLPSRKWGDNAGTAGDP